MTTTPFTLDIHFQPSFHRACSVRIEEDTAVLTAPASGVLPAFVHWTPVDPGAAAQVRASCASMLQAWEPRWGHGGIDGITIDGSLDDVEWGFRTFQLWSPRPGSMPQAAIRDALACFPVAADDHRLRTLLDQVANYLQLLPLVRIVNGYPVRAYIGSRLHWSKADEVRSALTQVPEDEPLVIDAADVGLPLLSRALSLPLLRKRQGEVRWRVKAEHAQELIDHGFEASSIETLPSLPITRAGYPILLDRLFIQSDELIALARTGTPDEVAEALRSTYGMPLDLAVRGAAELMSLARA